MKRNKRTGIMGGTFNPVHDAHVIMAKTAYKELDLDEVLIMPSSVPPHKLGLEIASAEDRSRMVKLAIEGEEGLIFSDFELKREGKTYSAETMSLLKALHPDTDYFFIIGADSLFTIETWYKPEVLLPLVTTVVFDRSGAMNGFIPDKTIRDETVTDKIKAIEEKYGCRMVFLHMPDMPVSSTGVRELIRQGKRPEHLPDKVFHYILEKGLYQ